MPQDHLHLLRFRAPAAAEETLAEFAAAAELDLATVRTPESAELLAQLFAESAAAADQLAARLRAELPRWLPDFDPASLERDTLRREDWAESWKRFFHVQRITPRLVVKPSWEAYTPAPGELVLELDPGMSFGTGYHGTTRACLEFLDRLSQELPEAALLDVGCGSGILALAAWKLGFRPVRAVDNDPDAVRIARENLERNGASGVAVEVADLADYLPPQPARVVVANILAPVLIRFAPRLASFLDSRHGPAYLALAGILHGQYPEVRATFTALGFTECATRAIDEWSSGLFRWR
ncbi:MAG: 50S ribosomal protein L11 methyltransferase [Lentisphaeria bacterium]|jgi:ribosomal protein L11 methyltransferase